MKWPDNRKYMSINPLMLMLLKFFFRRMDINKQVKLIKKRGVLLGPRLKDGRKVYTYMLQNLFVEVLYANDNVLDTPEKVSIINGLKNLNSYLEEEFKSNF